MATRTAGRIFTRSFLVPSVVIILLWVLAAIIAFILLIQATNDARSGRDGQLFPHGLPGIPIFEGFHLAGHFGVHPEWGLLVLLFVPLVIGVVWTVASLMKELRRD